jgi:hypothetical protein
MRCILPDPNSPDQLGDGLSAWSTTRILMGLFCALASRPSFFRASGSGGGSSRPGRIIPSRAKSSVKSNRPARFVSSTTGALSQSDYRPWREDGLRKLSLRGGKNLRGLHLRLPVILEMEAIGKQLDEQLASLFNGHRMGRLSDDVILIVSKPGRIATQLASAKEPTSSNWPQATLATMIPRNKRVIPAGFISYLPPFTA